MNKTILCVQTHGSVGERVLLVPTVRVAAGVGERDSPVPVENGVGIRDEDGIDVGSLFRKLRLTK